MISLIYLVEEELKKYFEECGYDPSKVKVKESRYADYQCASAFEIAKQTREGPMVIAQKVCDRINEGIRK